MTELIVSTNLDQTTEATKVGCYLCGRVDDQRISLREVRPEIKALLKVNVAAAAELTEICINCVELFSRAKAQIDSHHIVFEQTDHVLPTPLRMNADERFTGRGVTIAFLDSGFYAHDDLTKPENRIVAYHSIFDSDDDRTSLETTDVASWHGMMTSVVAAGNGYLSDQFYRGIAPDAKVVLVKIGRTGHIPDEHIQRGLEWILDNREKYDIRVVNISAGGDSEQSYLNSSLCQTVERAVTEGLIVVCAVGNAGMAPGHLVLPPASSPSAISVGGLDDQNSLDRAKRGMYRSSYGPTLDGLQKPEIIAPGIWVAAPILPFTPTADQAQLCSKLDKAADAELRGIIESSEGVDKDFDEARDLPVPLLRQLITIKLREGNVINQHYKYVDGTSFAAPIVASIAACMLEANPDLTPQRVKRILIDTAERVTGVEVERQGWGVVVPRRAVGVACNGNFGSH
ncbi:MAG: S8 family serine peptidase [Pyrinomonadaceae bacterium]